MAEKYKIAIIAPTAFYYHVPLYRRLANSSKIDLTVLYCSEESITGKDVKNAYGVPARFSDENLLEGYPYRFIKNYSPTPSIARWPFGLINIGVWKEIKNGQYDAIVLQAWTFLTQYISFLSCLIFKTPVFFMTDANILSEPIRLANPFKKAIKKVVLRFLFKKASGFLTAGKTNEQLYLHYGASSKKIVPMHFSWGYEHFIEEFNRLKPQREQIRSLFGVEKDDFVLLFVGRLISDKKIFDLLEAYNKANNNRKRLFFVGEGPLLAQVKKYIENLDIKGVYFAGFQTRKNLSKFYTLADALVLPSCWEPWGMVINEAMCFGLPIIASDKVGAVPDLVFNNKNGFIFPEGDINCLSRCIEKLFNMPAEERLSFGKESRKIIEEWINKIDPEKQIIDLIKRQKAGEKYEED